MRVKLYQLVEVYGRQHGVLLVSVGDLVGDGGALVLVVVQAKEGVLLQGNAYIFRN